MSQRAGYQTTSMIIVFFSLIAYISLVIFIYYNMVIYEPSQTLRLLILGVFETIMIVPLYIYVKTTNHSLKHACRLRRFPRQALLHIVVIGIGLFFFVDLIDYISDLVINSPNIENADYYCSSFFNFAALAITSLIIAPYVEECIFRGFMMRYMSRKNFSPAVAIIISATVFSIAHLNIWQSFTYFLAGCVLGFVAHYLRSVKPTIIIHIIFNLMVIIDINFPGIRSTLFYSNPILRWSILIFGNILLAWGLISITQNVKPAKRVKIM